MSQSLNNAPGTNSTTTLNALVPPEGPKSIYIAIDFTVAATAFIDFTLATMGAKITAIQSLWFDNSNNSESVEIDVQGTGQVITVPAGAQGTFPVIAANRPKFNVASPGNVIVRTCWLNVPLPANLWFPLAANPSGGAAPLAFAVAVGGTAVAAFSNARLSAGAIVNPFAATESLFVDLVNVAGTTAPGTHGTTVELVPGQAFDLPANFGGVVSVNAVTSGHAFTAYGVV